MSHDTTLRKQVTLFKKYTNLSTRLDLINLYGFLISFYSRNTISAISFYG